MFIFLSIYKNISRTSGNLILKCFFTMFVSLHSIKNTWLSYGEAYSIVSPSVVLEQKLSMWNVACIDAAGGECWCNLQGEAVLPPVFIHSPPVPDLFWTLTHRENFPSPSRIELQSMKWQKRSSALEAKKSLCMQPVCPATQTEGLVYQPDVSKKHYISYPLITSLLDHDFHRKVYIPLWMLMF